MAFSKTGWRRIVVEDQVYYWQSREDSSSLLDVRLEREPNRHLAVGCGWQCGHQIGGFRGVVTPRIVRGCIECAINSGWLDERPRLQLVLFDSLRCAIGQPSWSTSTVMQLARGIYNDLAFERMPILADALQDAGCDNDDILNHFRDPNATHVRGCWALDLVLGKE